jgi:tetratricopeptide (TPR) repeat protein
MLHDLVLSVYGGGAMMKTLLLAGLFLMAARAGAATPDDARQLHNEARDILRASSGAVSDPKVYAEAVRKLEKAQTLMEEAAKAGGGNDQLEQEISAALFWARRFANTQVAKELEKGGGGQVATPKHEAPPKTPDPAAAEAAFRKADEFESAHKNDDFSAALRWFQFATEHSGTDWSVRGLQRAREAQARHQALTAKNDAQKSEEAKLLADGDALLNAKKFEEALAKYEEAKKLKDSAAASQRIGHAQAGIGHKCRDEYAAKYMPVLGQYNEAVKKGDRAAVAALTQKAQEVVGQLKPLEQKALKSYDLAQAAFQHGLDLSGNFNLVCEAQIAILCFDRGKSSRSDCAKRLASLLPKYHPANDEERIVFEFSKSLFKNLGGIIRE